MELLVAWKESLSLLKPKNLKLLTIASVNTFIKGWAIFLRHVLWWLIPVIVLYYFVAYFLVTEYTIKYHAEKLTHWFPPLLIDFIRYGFLFYLVVHVWCFVMHSSINRKDIYYFFSVKNVVTYIVSSFLFCTIIMLWLGFIASPVHVLHQSSLHSEFFYGLSSWIRLGQFFLFPVVFNICLLWSIVTAFFSLDSDETLEGIVRSVVRSAKMIFYNVPGFMIVESGVIVAGIMVLDICKGIVARVLEIYLSWMFSYLGESVVTAYNAIVNSILLGISVGMVIPFLVAIISNLYIKQVYDHKDRYI